MTYADEVLADTPVAYYRLGEASGTSMVDSSGNGHHGTYVGSPTLGAPGLLGGDSDTAMVTGSGQYATTPSGSWLTLATVTVETLIQPSAISGTYPNRIIGNDDEISQRAYSLDINSSGHLYGTVWVGTVQRFCTGNTVLVVGQKYHVVMVYNGTAIKLYLNGMEDGSASYSGSVHAASASIYIGCDPYSGYRTTWRFQGTIDEVAIFSGGLSPTRIAVHADASQVNTIYPSVVTTSAAIPFTAPTVDVEISVDSVAAVTDFSVPLYESPASISASTVATTSDVQSRGITPAPVEIAATTSVPPPLVVVKIQAVRVAAIAAVPTSVPDIILRPTVVTGTSSVKAALVLADNAWVLPTAVASISTLPSASVSPVPSAISVVAAIPAAEYNPPPAIITDLVADASVPWEITFTWTNPTDADFDHVLLLRKLGLPYAEFGDDLADESIVAIEPSGSAATNNYDPLTAYPVASGDFHDVQDTTGRPDTGYRFTPASWYRYTPLVDGTLIIDTIGTANSEFDTYLSIADTLPDAEGNANWLDYDDDSGSAYGGGSLTSYIEIAVTAGTTYWICAQGYSSYDVGDLTFNLSGPNSSETPPNSAPTYVDTGLTLGQTYYYSIYSIDVVGTPSDTAIDVAVTVAELPAGEPFGVTVSMLAGSVSILAGTPVEPVPSEDIVFYGVPITITLTEPAGVTWVNDLLQPPPAVPGETTGWPGNIFDPAILRTPTDIRAEVWNYLNTEKIANLDYSAARQFLDEYNGVGSGSLQVPAIHPDAALLRRDRVLRFYYKDIQDAVFASIIEGRKTNVVAEAGSNWAAVSGRGLLAWLEDAVVLPYVTDLDKQWLHDNPTAQSVMPDGTRVLVESNIMPYAPDVRAFNFGSRDAFNHVMFNDVGPGSSGANQELLAPWSNLTSGDGVTYASRSDKVRGYPIGWPDPSAQWIWQTNPQADVKDGLQVSFRGFFTLGAQTTVDIYGTADDTADFYIDGVQKLFSTPGYKTLGHARVTLSQGQHELQITGRNAYLPALALNPASVIATVRNSSSGTIIFRTNTTQWQYTRWINNFLVTEANYGPGWHRPLGITQSAKAPLNRKQYFPTDWPDPAAQWLWGSDPTHSAPGEQLCWFRAKVWIETSGTYRWFCTADDSYIMWINGIEVLSLEYDGSAAGGWTRTDEIDVKLDRGFHVFAMRGRNATRPNPTDPRSNPAAVIGTLMTLDSNQKPYIPVAAARTYYTGSSPDVGWYANWSAPAWKAGDVLYTLVKEAQARAVTRLQNVTMDFNATTDSNGEEWTTRVSRTWDVGTSLLQVAFDLCELGVDIWMTPDNVLHCAERRGSDIPTFSVLYGKNISGYDVDETFTGASVAYTRTRTGWFTLESDNANIILGGKRETGISLANTDSEDVQVGVSNRAIGAVVMANMVATAQSIVPVDGSVPYVDGNISDIIYVLSPDGSSRMGRLLSISITENEAGASTWVPEIEIWNSPFGDGVDPNRPHDPVDPNNPYDPSTWVPSAEDWTRFIPEGAGSDYPRAVTLAQASAWVDGAPSPSPSGAIPVPLNSAQAPRVLPNAYNNGTPPNAERVAVAPTAPLITAGYHLWVDTSGIV